MASDRPHARLAAFWAVLGVLAALAVFPYAAALLPAAFAKVRVPIMVVACLQSLQAGAMMFGGAWVGLRLGEKLGLDSPIARAWVYRVQHTGDWSARTLVLAGLAGFAVGMVMLGLDRLVFLRVQPEAIQRLAGGIARWKGLLASFYGGIGEEVLTRLFAMTLLVWLIAWATGRRTAPVFWAAIILAAVGFAAAHIPATAVLAPLTRPVVARILVLNSLGGILFGWLYWRRGLEHAMVAHFCCDLALHVVGA